MTDDRDALAAAVVVEVERRVKGMTRKVQRGHLEFLDWVETSDGVWLDPRDGTTVSLAIAIRRSIGRCLHGEAVEEDV